MEDEFLPEDMFSISRDEFYIFVSAIMAFILAVVITAFMCVCCIQK